VLVSLYSRIMICNNNNSAWNIKEETNMNNPTEEQISPINGEEELEFGEKPQARVPPRMRLLFYEDGTTELVSTKKLLCNPSIIAVRVNMGDKLLKTLRNRGKVLV